MIGFAVSVALVLLSASIATGLSVRDDLGIGTFAGRDVSHR